MKSMVFLTIVVFLPTLSIARRYGSRSRAASLIRSAIESICFLIDGSAVRSASARSFFARSMNRSARCSGVSILT
jgi:hypothetical protein